jgi:3-oxoacyl-[acyl-carrier protein] reductase
MSDYLVRWGRKRWFVKLVKFLRLPITFPVVLQRAEGAYTARPLAGRTFACGDSGGPLSDHLIELGAVSGEGAVDALVFDARSLVTPKDLAALHTWFHPRIGSLARHGRVVVLGLDPIGSHPAERAGVQAGLSGFVRSLAKELGRRGATANLIRTPSPAGQPIGLLAFLLSRRSAFVTGQVVDANDAVSTVLERPLAGKIAAVTGAARGIGAATAGRLVAEGARVIAVDRPSDTALLEATCAANGSVPCSFDVTDPEGATTLKLAAAGQGGAIDVLVHNAGITRDKTLGRMTSEAWDLCLAINLTAVFNLTAALDANGGLASDARIVCLSSIAGVAGNVGQTNYATAKAGLAGWVRHSAAERSGRGGAINAVAPGLIETRMTASLPFLTREGGRRLSSLKQGGQPIDVAEAITFLSTSHAAGLDGQLLRVCGGSLIGA